MNRAYLTIFVTYALSFVYMLLTTLQHAITSSDLVIFTLFTLLSMIALVFVGNDRKGGYVLSMIILAFMLSYFVFLFVEAATIVRFGLIVLQVISFIVCVFAGTVNRVSSYEFTTEYQPEMKQLQEEKISTEQAFEKLRSAFDKAAKERDIEGTIVVDEPLAQVEKRIEKKVVKKSAPKEAIKKKVVTKKKTAKTSTKKAAKKTSKKSTPKKTSTKKVAKKKVAKKKTVTKKKKSSKKANKKRK